MKNSISNFCISDLFTSIRLIEVRAPKIALKNGTANLECIYDLEGDTLEVLRWYKDEHLNYSYRPNESPQKQKFCLAGVNFDVCFFFKQLSKTSFYITQIFADYQLNRKFYHSEVD